jgi:hypothetical protein
MRGATVPACCRMLPHGGPCCGAKKVQRPLVDFTSRPVCGRKRHQEPARGTNEGEVNEKDRSSFSHSEVPDWAWNAAWAGSSRF